MTSYNHLDFGSRYKAYRKRLASITVWEKRYPPLVRKVKEAQFHQDRQNIINAKVAKHGITKEDAAAAHDLVISDYAAYLASLNLIGD